MAKAQMLSVELSSRMADAVRDAVASGDYADADEVVRDALRDWSAKRRVATAEIEELRRLIQEGDESGPGIDAELVFAQLRAKYAAMADG
jgi:antitoxin ParD1/3/4